MKKKLTILLAIAMMGTMLTACGGSTTTTEDSSAEDTQAVADVETEAQDDDADADADADADTDEEDVDETEAQTEAQVLVLPEGTAVEDGDAYLAFGDAQWWMQYGGSEMDNLSFGAVTAHIDGDGTYTVSLDASNEDAVSTNGLDTIGGCSFCAIVIQNGEELFPDQATSITIDSITIDGVEVEFTKNYCNYEDGNLRTNIFNSYVSEAPTEDVWTADGSLDDISAQIVPASTFDCFSKIEVTFTISSTGDTADGDDAEVADDAEVDEEADGDAEADEEADVEADAE